MARLHTPSLGWPARKKTDWPKPRTNEVTAAIVAVRSSLGGADFQGLMITTATGNDDDRLSMYATGGTFAPRMDGQEDSCLCRETVFYFIFYCFAVTVVMGN